MSQWMLAEPGMPALLLPSARLFPALSLIADVNLELVPAPTCSAQSTATGQGVIPPQHTMDAFSRK